MKTAAENVLEWINEYYEEYGTPTLGNIQHQLKMEIENEKRVLSLGTNVHPNGEKDCDTLTVPDLRNKLSPICHLILLVEDGDYIEAVNAIEKAKEMVNYIAQREVYE
jgi:hypothetical protein